jgi:hypothetical protein
MAVAVRWEYHEPEIDLPPTRAGSVHSTPARSSCPSDAALAPETHHRGSIHSVHEPRAVVDAPRQRAVQLREEQHAETQAEGGRLRRQQGDHRCRQTC